MIKVGEQCPEFNLTDHKGNNVNNSELKGKNFLLSFHPLAYTGVCAKQMQDLDENYETFTKYNTVPFGVSIDTSFSKNTWSKELELKNLRMLADFWPHGELAIKLGIFKGNEGFSERCNILVGKDGTVKWVKLYDVPEQPDIKEVFEQIKGLE